MRFVKSLSLNIANKVDLQLYLFFDDVHNLAIKVERQLKRRKSFQTFSTKGPSNHFEIETPPLCVEALDKGKCVASESPKK